MWLCPSLSHHPSHQPHSRGSGPSMGPCTLAQDLLIIWGELHGLAGELRVEVVQAIVICDLGLEGRQGLLLFQLGTLTRERSDRG